MKNPTTATDTAPHTSSPRPSTTSLSIGIITGISAGSVLLLVMIIIFICCCRKCLEKGHRRESQAENNPKSTEADSTHASNHDEYAYETLRVDNREDGIYTRTYSIPQTPTTANTPEANQSANAALDTAKQKDNNGHKNTEEQLYENIRSTTREPLREIHPEVRPSEESSLAGSTEGVLSKNLNSAQSPHQHDEENTQKITYMNLGELYENGPPAKNREPENVYCNLPSNR
ncbi:hypothetical protein P5673_003700 [Acropora cervicornis]|uniref:Uncharacterized protein n=1 Tax=Acropora cervicornis TaxID=6130 RepID=A0AAD9R0Z4_ACRCE|nr:hypothetical protein P5673_003700 [Acropora cervicornis]